LGVIVRNRPEPTPSVTEWTAAYRPTGRVAWDHPERSHPQSTGMMVHPGNHLPHSAGWLLTSHHTFPRRLRSCSGIVTGASSRWRRRVPRNRDTCSGAVECPGNVTACSAPLSGPEP